MSCIEQMKYKIVLDKTTYKEARDYIEKNSDEVYYVSPGYKVFKDYRIIGVPPVALGAKGSALIFTYTKPCYGTFVLCVDSEDSVKEIEKLRKMEKEKGTKKEASSLKKGKQNKTTKSFRELPSSFQDIWKK
jgi:hypothetical protein